MDFDMISDESIEGEDTCKVGMLSVLTAVWIFGSVATPVTEDGALEIVSKLWVSKLKALSFWENYKGILLIKS